MAAPGQNFNQTSLVAETPEAVSQTLVAAASNVPQYTVNMAGAGSLVLTRRYTPTWAIVVAVLGVIFYHIGPLALLVKNTETITVTLMAEEGGTRVTISGIGSHEMLTRIASALSAMPALDAEAVSLSESNAGDTKVCPACAESVKAAAKVCRFCGHEFTEAEPTPATA
jgi:hypothetical protein